MKINYKIKEGRNIKDCKIGDKVVFIKEGILDWESEDWAKANRLELNNIYIIKDFEMKLSDESFIDLKGYSYSMSPNHFKLL